MRDGAVADIGDGFHVAVRVRRKTRLRRDGIVVPHPQLPPIGASGVVVVGKREMMVRIKPPVVRGAEAGKGSNFDHGHSPEAVSRWICSLRPFSISAIKW